MPFLCPVDAGEWEKSNRVQLFPEKLQRWVIALAVDGTESRDDIARIARKFMGNVFSRGVPALGSDIGTATDFQILDVTSQQPGMPDPTQTREGLDPIPFLKPGPVAFVIVEFAWRGPASEMPWPATRLVGFGRLHGVNSFCPLDANALLVATKNLQQPAPPRQLDDPGLGGGPLGDFAKNIGSIAATITTTIVVGALAWIVLKLETK